MSFLPPKLGADKRVLPSEVNQKHAVLQPSASGQYSFDWLLQVSISILLPPSVGGMYHSIDISPSTYQRIQILAAKQSNGYTASQYEKTR